jgi:hypothetical protein
MSRSRYAIASVMSFYKCDYGQGVTVDEQRTIMAKTFGNPIGGQLADPWPADHPLAGERVAIFAFEVISVDREAEGMRSYHVAPATYAREGSNWPARREPQGITVKWVACGTGTVVRPADRQCEEPMCEVLPDDPQLV